MKLTDFEELRKLRVELIYIYITANKADVEYLYNKDIYRDKLIIDKDNEFYKE